MGDSQIAKYVDVDEQLSSVPGVGVISAASVVSELGDVSRFVDEKGVCCYCGITLLCIRVGRDVETVTSLSMGQSGLGEF